MNFLQEEPKPAEPAVEEKKDEPAKAEEEAMETEEAAKPEAKSEDAAAPAPEPEKAASPAVDAAKPASPAKSAEPAKEEEKAVKTSRRLMAAEERRAEGLLAGQLLICPLKTSQSLVVSGQRISGQIFKVCQLLYIHPPRPRPGTDSHVSPL